MKFIFQRRQKSLWPDRILCQIRTALESPIFEFLDTAVSPIGFSTRSRIRRLAVCMSRVKSRNAVLSSTRPVAAFQPVRPASM